MAPIGQSVAADEAMEVESDFQDWTLEMDAVNKQYGAAQAAEDARLEDTITAIEDQIQADADGLFGTLNNYMQQCLEKMQQEMKVSVSRQVQSHLQLEKMKAEHQKRRQERSEAKKKQIIDLFNKHHFPANPRRKETPSAIPEQEQPARRPQVKSSQSQNTISSHPSKTNSPVPTTNGSFRTSEDPRRPAEVQTSKPSDRSASATPGANQGNRAVSATADSISTPAVEGSKAPSVDLERVIDPLGAAASKRKGDIFASGPADTVKRARVEQKKDRESAASAEGTGSHTPQRSSPQIPTPHTQRTISFDEVYQDGQAEHKHVIIEYMEVSGKFYILKCDEHHVHFGSNPLAGAAKHLSSTQHNKLPKTHELAIEKLGYYVYDCTRELADKNNASFLQAVKNGYEPFNANRLTKAEKVARGIEITDSFSHSPAGTTGRRKSSKEAELVDGGSGGDKHQFRGITDPVRGELYLGYWAKTKTKFPVIILPLGDLRAAGLNGNLLETSLRKNIPKCYDVTHPTPDTHVIHGWAEGYEDGGPKVTKREFPVMYFDKHYLVGWITARHLSEFDFEDPNPKAYPGYYAARDYWAKIQDEGCAGYEDWKKRGRIRNPSLTPPDSKEASPVAGNEKTSTETTNNSTPTTSSRPELPKSTGDAKDEADEEMVDAEDLEDDDASVVSLADTDLNGASEHSDVEMEMGDEVSPNAAKPEAIKGSEQPVGGQDSSKADQIPSVDHATKPSTQPKQVPPSENLKTTSPSTQAHVPASQKPTEKFPQALSIPTPPFNSTEASPTATASPVITPTSVLASTPRQTAQQFATNALHIDTTKNMTNGVNSTQSGQKDGSNTTRQTTAPPKPANIPVQGNPEVQPPRDISKVPSSSPNMSNQIVPSKPQKAEPATVKSPVRKQDIPSTGSAIYGPEKNPMNGYRYGHYPPAPVSLPSTKEQPRVLSSVRVASSPQKDSRPSSPLATARPIQASMQQSRSPVPNGGAMDQARGLPFGAQLPPRPVGTSPVPSTQATFGGIAQRSQSIISARSISPSVGPVRSTSSTPTPASEVTSRKSTPTIILGDKSIGWKAVRNSSFSQPPQSSFSTAAAASREGAGGRSASQDRRGFSLSSIVTSSTQGSVSASPHPPPAAGGRDLYFDATAYIDSTDTKKYIKDTHSPYLRVTVDPNRGIAETAAGEAIAVTLDPRDVLEVVVRPASTDVESVSLIYRGQGNRPEHWAFATRHISGRRLTGKIQARSFCKWIMSVNPNVNYKNQGTADESRHSSAARSPAVTFD